MAVVPAQADSFVFELGRGDGVNMGRVAYQLPLKTQWQFRNNLQVTSYLEPAIGFWRGNSNIHDDPKMYELALTPVFRLEQQSRSAIAPYIENGVGIHVITGHHVTDDRDLGSNYHFGTHIGVGLRFGTRHEFDFGYRLQHLSNAGLKQPNEGINFNMLHFAYLY